MTQESQDKKATIQQIYSWASQNTQETRLSTSYTYLWPRVATELLTTLEMSQGSLIALVGISGVGKSSAMSQIARKLTEKFGDGRICRFKWPGNYQDHADRILEFLKQQRIEGNKEVIIQELVEHAVDKRDPKALSKQMGELLHGEWDKISKQPREELKESLAALLVGKDPNDLAMALLGPREVKHWKGDLIVHLMSHCHTILLDLRDYGLEDVRAMNTDLREIQYLWQRMVERLVRKSETAVPNLVFVLQKELAFTGEAEAANYYLGKARTFEITPFAPDQLVSAYVSEFGSKYPFGEDLARIARVSRGVFRRFLRYLAVCIELHKLEGKQEEALSQMTIDEILNRELEKDWEVDLRQLFPHGDTHRKALKILNILTKTTEGFIPQEKFPDLVYNLGQAETSRILTELEEHGYIKRIWVDRKRHVRLNI